MAISPQLTKHNASITGEHNLTFPMLSDPGNTVAARFGIRFQLPAPLREVYKSIGLDLKEFNGDESGTLPLPARFIVDAEGIVRDARVSPDSSSRPSIADLMEALDGLTPARPRSAADRPRRPRR